MLLVKRSKTSRVKYSGFVIILSLILTFGNSATLSNAAKLTQSETYITGLHTKFYFEILTPQFWIINKMHHTEIILQIEEFGKTMDYITGSLGVKIKDSNDFIYFTARYDIDLYPESKEESSIFDYICELDYQRNRELLKLCLIGSSVDFEAIDQTLDNTVELPFEKDLEEKFDDIMNNSPSIFEKQKFDFEFNFTNRWTSGDNPKSLQLLLSPNFSEVAIDEKGDLTITTTELGWTEFYRYILNPDDKIWYEEIPLWLWVSLIYLLVKSARMRRDPRLR